MRTILVGLLLLVGCVASEDSRSSSSSGGNGACEDADDCKIEGSQIGVEGLVLVLGSTSVTFHDWVAKPGEPNEFIGFSITLDGASSINYFVKTGTATYPSSAMTWKHEGLDCHGISNVDFPDGDPNCDNPDGCGGGDGGGGGGGDDDGGCDNPDGCDGGDGGDGPVT